MNKRLRGLVFLYGEVNVAVTFTMPPPSMVTGHWFGFEPAVHPVQPPNLEFAPGDAVNVTTSPAGNCAPQVVPGQLIPPGWLVTVPTPTPAGVTTNSPLVALPPGQFLLAGSFTVTN